MPSLVAKHTVLVVSHGNTIRMLAQLVEGLTDAEACALEVPTGAPRIWRGLDSRVARAEPREM